MKKIFLVLLFAVCILLTACGNSSQPKLKNIDEVKIHYIKLSDKTVDYLKNRSEYKELYNQDKKFVVYAHCDYCPYIKRIENAVNEYSKQNKYKGHYNFYLQNTPGYMTFESSDDMNAFTAFFNACSTFCIVNTKTNELFTVSGSRVSLAQNMYYILDELRYW